MGKTVYYKSDPFLRRVLAWLIHISAACSAMGVSAQPWYVATNSASDGPGTAWSNAWHTIQSAVDVATNGDTVWVTNGTYAPVAEIVISQAITVRGFQGPEFTCIDGSGGHCCFKLGPEGCMLTGLTLTNGFAMMPPTDFYGGGVCCIGSAPVVSNCVFMYNRARYFGGGMYQGTAYNCDFTWNIAYLNGGGVASGRVDHCTFSGNQAKDFGGGLYQGTATDCLFTNNIAFRDGGGVHQGSANHCTFIGNSSHENGGGMRLGTATDCLFADNSAIADGGGAREITANNCLFSGNMADNGAGMSGGTANDCTFTLNLPTENGGGMYNGQANRCCFSSNSADNGGGAMGTIATHCLFTDNSAKWVGGGLDQGAANNCTFTGNSSERYGGGMGGATSRNCIVWFNTADSGSNNLYLTDARYTCSPELINGVDGNITDAPQFAVLGGAHLTTSSPCLDAGDNAAMSAGPDRDGIPRPLDGNADGTNTVDMGCYEFVSSVADSDGDGLSDSNEWYGTGTSPAMTNTDGDCFGDYDEMIADTDGADSNDWFHLTALSNSLPVSVCFDSSSNRLYTLTVCSNLPDGSWAPVPGIPPRRGVGGGDAMQDTNPPPRDRFYRLEVALP